MLSCRYKFYTVCSTHLVMQVSMWFFYRSLPTLSEERSPWRPVSHLKKFVRAPIKVLLYLSMALLVCSPNVLFKIILQVHFPGLYLKNNSFRHKTLVWHRPWSPELYVVTAARSVLSNKKWTIPPTMALWEQKQPKFGQSSQLGNQWLVVTNCDPQYRELQKRMFTRWTTFRGHLNFLLL